MDQIRFRLSQDTATEIRRRVRTSREAKGYLANEPDASVLSDHDTPLILSFLEEEFEGFLGELFTFHQKNIDPVALHSWDYPGDWLCPMTTGATAFLEGDQQASVFSKSGLYTAFLSLVPESSTLKG